MLSLRAWFIILCGFIFVGIEADKEFLYPVAANITQGSVNIYLVYQKSIDHLELLVWDPITKATRRGLLSTFTPGVLKILPDDSGFSFVDKGGRVKVKSFDKRSPKSVSFKEPIDEITEIQWLNSSTFYFMAKAAQHYSLFQGTTQGDLHVLAKSDHADYMYPQKVGESLFFIERVKYHDGYHYALVQTSYPLIPTYTLQGDTVAEQMALLKQEQAEQRISLVKEEDISSILDLGNQTASFLYMASPEQGFYIEHPRIIEKQQECVDFSYYQIDKQKDDWIKKKLFSFKLPAHFFLEENEFRLYESLLPFLPRHTEKGIFFSHCYDVKRLKTGVFKCDIEKSSLSNVSLQPSVDIIGDTFFSPLCVGSMVFYGGMLLPEDLGTGNRLPTIWINEEGLLCADLPVSFDIQHEELSRHA